MMLSSAGVIDGIRRLDVKTARAVARALEATADDMTRTTDPHAEAVALAVGAVDRARIAT
jgi:hypothetical protein